MTTPQNRALRRGLIGVLAMLLALDVLVFFAASNAVNRTRGDFCAFAAQVKAAAHQLPQVPGRVQAEQAYTQLQARLDC